MIALLLLAIAALSVALLLRGRAAFSDLEDQMEQLQQLQNVGETVIEVSGDSARAAISRLGISLPDSATNVFFARQGAVRPAYWVRFGLSDEDVDTFLAETCLAATEDGQIPSFDYAVAPDILVNLTWWHPEGATNPAGGTCRWRPGVELRLLLDRAERGQQIVYIELTDDEEPQAD